MGAKHHTSLTVFPLSQGRGGHHLFVAAKYYILTNSISRHHFSLPLKIYVGLWTSSAAFLNLVVCDHRGL